MSRTQDELHRLLIRDQATIVPNAEIKKMRALLLGVYCSLGESVKTRDDRSREVLDAQMATVAKVVSMCVDALGIGETEAFIDTNADLPY